MPDPKSMRVTVVTANGAKYQGPWEPWTPEERQALEGVLSRLSDEKGKLSLELASGETMYFNRRHVVGVQVGER